MEQILQQLVPITDEYNSESIFNLLGEYYKSGNDDWKKYCYWNDKFYTRNLILKNDLFEVMLICWKRGHESPIHDHSKQHCWLLVLKGAVEEISYKQLDDNNLKPMDTNIYNNGTAVHTDEDLDWHKIKSLDETVTLHIYSKPIDYCQIYDTKENQIKRVKTTYHTIDTIKQ